MTKKKSNVPITNNPLWGGRFDLGPGTLTSRINASIDFDKALAAEDLAGSRAHCAMLVSTGVISKKDGQAILDGLDTIQSEILSGKFKYSQELEDIHMHVEARLSELIGEPAGRLHTARSRNDQVATDLRLWVRNAASGIDQAFHLLQVALVDLAELHTDTILPGLTHLQPAQPVVFAHHLLAYFEMFERDRGRFVDCVKRLNECPLGAAALAGTSFTIDRERTSKELGFDKPMNNSIDAVSSRDFVIEFLACCSTTAINLSRLSEEITLWASPSLGFVSLPDAFSTGSSIMPQKKNPDTAELVRAKSGRIIGALTGLMVVLKGLPLAYAKDLQEDKEPVFDSAAQLHLCLEVTAGLISELTVNKDAMMAATKKGFLTATDLADWLVQNQNISFRNAHELTGKIVKLAEKKNCLLSDLSLDELQSVSSSITEEVFGALKIESSVNRRISLGGTAPARVREALSSARKRLG